MTKLNAADNPTGKNGMYGKSPIIFNSGELMVRFSYFNDNRSPVFNEFHKSILASPVNLYFLELELLSGATPSRKSNLLAGFFLR